VRLVVLAVTAKAPAKSRFNSRLVRLVAGTLAAIAQGKLSFNSRLVRLVVFYRLAKGKKTAVSIPDWCDW